MSAFTDSGFPRVNVFIDNTGLLRVTNAKLTALDGTQAALTLAGSLTIIDKLGAEVSGQTFPTALTLNSPGDYSCFIESDLALVALDEYTAVITFGTVPNSRADFNVKFTAVDRT
jgi:hypothetical protein|tara:strand:+ start:426 stop:770 length:345 start_codon:yes stop_codon:yes gene_type:complete